MAATTGITGVRATHEEYDEHLDTWERCCDVIEGGNRVLKEKRETYLPRYYEEDDDSYRLRLRNTILVNFAYRTQIGYRGMLLRRPAVVSLPDSVLPMMDNVTLSGMSLKIFLGEVIEEVLTTGRIGLFVNYPKAQSATLADAQLQNLRPSLHAVEPEDITNWNTRNINNEDVLSLVVIKEEVCIPTDEFSGKEEERYRVLDLVDLPTPAGGIETVYRVRVMMHDKEKSVDVTLEEDYPLMGGAFMDRIPFFFASADCTSPDVDEPPLVDLVDLNLAHYNMTSSLLHGAFYSGIPQPWIAGWSPKPGERLRLGGAAWCFETIGTKVGMLEVGTSGFPVLEKTLDRMENQAVIIGSRLLELHLPGGQESTSTAAIHFSGEHSMLASIGQAVSEAMTQALKKFVDWTGADSSDTKLVLNSDFFNEPMKDVERLSIVKSWQAGAISDEIKFGLLQQKGDIPADTTFEAEQARIQQSTGLQSVAKPIKDQPLTDQINPNVPDGETEGADAPADRETEPATAQATPASSSKAVALPATPAPEHPMPDMAAHHAAMQASADQQTAILDKISTAMSQPQAAPIVNIAAQPAPIVNVAAPIVNLPEQPPINVNIAPAAVTVNTPDVNVAAPNVSVAAPTVNVTTPDVTVNQPAITVNTPDVVVNQAPVIVNVPEPKEIPPQAAPVVVNTQTGNRTIEMVRDKSGKIVGANVTENN